MPRNQYCERLDEIRELIAAGEILPDQLHSSRALPSEEQTPAAIRGLCRGIGAIRRIRQLGRSADRSLFRRNYFSASRMDHITVKPMKGTAPRGLMLEMTTSEAGNWPPRKDRAENVMIVDLMRNDLSPSPTGR